MAPETSSPLLLVNDREADLLALETALAPLGLPMVRASSADAGLRAVEQQPFALAIIDLHMPEMNGIEMVRRLRRHHDKHALPVIIVSAYDMPGSRLAEIYALGAADFIPLPVAAEMLRGRVSLLLDLRRQARRAEAQAQEIQRAADATASAQRERFQLLADAAADYALIFIDRGGTVSEWTGAAENLFGYSAPEAIGQNFAFLFTPEDRAHGAPEAELKGARATGQARDDRLHVRKDGSRFPTTGRTIALRSPAGELNGFAKVVRDATTLYELQESERKFRQIFETANEGIWLLDVEARIEMVNARMAELLGYRPADLVGRHKTDFVFPEDRAAIIQLFEERRQGKTVAIEVRFRHQNGEAVWTLMSARPRYHNGAFVGALDMFTDITARRSAEQRFRLFFESSAAGHVLVEPKTRRFLGANRRFCEIVGRSWEELLHLTFSAITHPDDRAADEIRFADLYHGRVPEVTAQKRYVRPDGTAVWVHLTSTAIREGSKMPTLQLTVVQDITELKVVEAEWTESRTRLRLAIEAAHLGVFFRDGRTGRDTWNDHAKQMLGVPNDTPASLEVLFSRVHPEDKPRIEGMAARLLDPKNAAEEFGVDFRVVWPDGGVRYLSAHGLTTPPDRDHPGVQVIGTVRDITAMKDLEQELRRKVAERTRDLEEKTRQLESFSYTVAHDLRAPLRSINGYAELLIDEIATSDVASKVEMLERIKAATRRLDLLIRDLMAYSRIAQVDVRLERVDLGAAFQRALRELQPEIDRRQADIRVRDPLPPVLAEKTIVEQVVFNLLSNAVKFSPTGKPPVVEVWADERADRVVLHVRDRGIGIAPEYHDRIFRVFERLEASRDYPGTGIGLAIVAKGMSRTGGRYGVQSAVGEGSTFWIEMRKADA